MFYPGFIQRQRQEIKYVEKSLAIYNSYFFMGSKILNTEVLLSALHCIHLSLIFCYQKCISVNPFLEFCQRFFKLSCTWTAIFRATIQLIFKIFRHSATFHFRHFKFGGSKPGLCRTVLSLDKKPCSLSLRFTRTF